MAMGDVERDRILGSMLSSCNALVSPVKITRRLELNVQSVMTIYNAVLTGRRVLFVGYNHPAGEICEIVLAACALVSPPFEVRALVALFLLPCFVFDEATAIESSWCSPIYIK